MWYDENWMKRNQEKYQAMAMRETQELPEFNCDKNIIQVKSEIEYLGI